MLERERDGVAHAEAHAQVGRSEYPHTTTLSQITL
jgi:hypothetical protein